MKKISLLLVFAVLIIFSNCSIDRSGDSFDDYYSKSSDSDSSGSGNSGQQAGKITAAEWNDLYNWDFWKNLISGQNFANKPDYWKFYHNNRVSVAVKNGTEPIVDAEVKLLKNGNTVWTARTDNFGRAELWIDLFQKNTTVNINDYALIVNGQPITVGLKLFEEGINEIQLDNGSNNLNRVELAFIVDATGSMSDELEFLKDDLQDVIQRVEAANQSLNIFTASVFYRDEGDDYLIRKSGFTGELNNTLHFINAQGAGGGGDFPEAVHTALKTGIDELQWSGNAKTRIAFLLLDAPPHYESQIISDLQNSIEKAAQKGIKVIPITASGIDKETEFLMRFFAISTDGTYVFITNDSGIGNDHLEASVGEYQVEYLNDLMVRLIGKYTE